MKKYIFILIAAFAGSACSDFLDVESQSIVDKDELFKTPEGFMEALNGLYSRSTKTNLYGGELTFGFPDVLAQNYTMNADNPYTQTASFDYKDKVFISKRDGVWAGLYGVISDCNLILESLEKSQDVLPKDMYDLIKGETLGLRAYLHIDAYRLFGNSIATNPTARNIPYVTSFSSQVTPFSTGKEVLEFAIADLKAASDLLKKTDPITTAGYRIGYITDTEDPDDLPDDESNEEESSVLFLQNRRHRMNYYAVCGTLARAYLCVGEKQQALLYAEEVIKAEKFSWTKEQDFAAAEVHMKDRILYKELIFGWFIDTESGAREVTDRFERDVGGKGQFTSAVLGNSIYEIAGAGAEDLRYKEWFEKQNASFEVLALQKYVQQTDEEKTDRHYLMAPAIRLSEMYYIAAECSFPTDQNKALELFNEVRVNRGIGTALSGVSSENEFINELIKECRKEFFGEGQIFYMYKRLNKAIRGQGGNEIPADALKFVLPLPENEIEFGKRG